MSYPAYHRSKVFLHLSMAFAVAGLLSGCGSIININPNFETIWKWDAETYMIEGALTRGFASFPRVGYVQGEGDSTDRGSFRLIGPQGVGIDARGIYVPTEIISLDPERRFRKTFTVRSRYGLINLFAWDDLNRNGVRDLNEQIGGEWELKKQDIRGWSFNAPAWNQFNFTFTK
jgi:hypothetical protein